MKRLIMLTVLLVSFICAGNVKADSFPINSLAYLIEYQASITAGDKLFDQWWYGSDNGNGLPGIVQTVNGIGPDLSSILVTPLNDGGLDPGPGLLFDVYNDALSVIGPGEIDFYFGFRVSTLGNQLIKDNSLSLIQGFWDNNSSNGHSISESIFDAAGNNLGEKYVEVSYDGRIDTTIFDDSANFYPTDIIFVEKRIQIWAGTGSSTGIRRFEQRFSQTPEPATMLLLGTGLVGVAGAVRRKKKKA